MSDSLELVKGQRVHPTTEAIYRYIIRHKRMHAGESPTRREIGAAVGLSSPSTVHIHLMTLHKAGVIRLGAGKSRMISIPGAEWVGPEEMGLISHGNGRCVVEER